MANGCVRVYSGLMDMMTDNEVEAVLGHELGHVALGHSRKSDANRVCDYCRRAMQFHLPAKRLQSLFKSQLGDIAEGMVTLLSPALKSRMLMISPTI